MRPDASHIRKVLVVSNTHWDREFRRSFEKTRRRLVTMMDVTLDILDRDDRYHSFTLDGHSILLEDYLAVRPERAEQVRRLLADGRLVAGPYYTLAEEFSIGHEALVRNLLFGRRAVEALGGKVGPVAYTPSSWGQTGQLPQVFADFGLRYMMFYRGISHHEADAEYVWEAPDGTRMLASRFALYARYNWYYQVHRPVTVGRVFEKDYTWGERDEVPFRVADGLAGEDLAFELLAPATDYDRTRLKQAVEDMIAREGPHFTTPVFLAMHGHDISVAHPLETRILDDARELLGDRYAFEHTDLAGFWAEAEKHLDRDAMPVLTGERRAYLKEGMWTHLLPGTVSARTYLKQQDFDATVRLAYLGEPLDALAVATGAEPATRYLHLGWRYLLSNHTHDANGGCAPDAVCRDMSYRYRKAADLGDVAVEDAMAHVARNLEPGDLPADAMQLVVYNPLPVERDAVTLVDLELPADRPAPAARLTSDADADPPRQPVSAEASSSFVDSIWDVPRILESNRVRFYARLSSLPALGYRTYRIEPESDELRPAPAASLLTGPTAMANEHLHAEVRGDGTVDLTCKATGRTYRGLNALRDEGECGSAWKHVPPTYDAVHTSRGVAASVAAVEDGPLVAAVEARYDFAVPADYDDGTRRSDRLVNLPVRVVYRLAAGARTLDVTVTVDNRARDHRLRACLPTGLAAEVSHADSHFDVVARPVAVPDSTGWVERAFGTHPLRSFADVSDGTDGLAVLPHGLFEYEVLEDDDRTLALTLLRACRIKLMVSEEKQTELPDEGIQCPGRQSFRYGICPHAGTWEDAGLLTEAALGYVPVRAAMTGRGQGHLPGEMSLLTLDNTVLHVTAVKRAEDGEGLIVRLFNPTAEQQAATLAFGRPVASAARCRMDESEIEPTTPAGGDRLEVALAPKKIATWRVVLD